MAEATERPCPDCGGAMAPIFIVDKTHISGGYHQSLQYTLPGTTPSFWLGKFPIKGTVGAAMCGGCGRIVLRGIPEGQPDGGET
jgi:hypothetical protein